MDNYEDKLLYLLKHQKNKCLVCNNWMSLSEHLSLHHKCRQHKWRRKKFPRFIDSLLNLELLHNHCHITKDGSHISDLMAEKWELFLSKKSHKKTNKFVNNLTNE